MKKFYVHRISVKFALIFLLITTGTIINSCRKDQSSNTTAPPELLAAKIWYESTYQSSLTSINRSLSHTSRAVTSKGKFNYSAAIKPDWNHGASYKRYSTGVVELPIDPSSSSISSDLKNMTTGKIIYKKEYSKTSFLLLNDGSGYQAYIMILMADSAYLNNDLKKLNLTTYRKRDPTFTGMVLYFTPDGNYVSSFLYQNGSLTNPSVLQPSINRHNAQINRSLSSIRLEAAATEDCYDYYNDTYYDGELTHEEFLYEICYGSDDSGGGGSGSSGGTSSPTTGGGSGSAPGTPPTVPCPPQSSSGDAVSHHIALQVAPQPTPVDGDGGLPPPTTLSSNPCDPTPSIGLAFSVDQAYNGINGTKPIAENPDRCSGASSMWNQGVANSQEVAGLLTQDGQFLTIAMNGAGSSTWGGLYTYQGQVYYTYPTSQGAPTQTYAGMIISAGQYFIPISATVHTHTPCIKDGTDGITNGVLSSGDQRLASKYTQINHYIIGCGALGSFNSYSTEASVVQVGDLSVTCSSIH